MKWEKIIKPTFIKIILTIIFFIPTLFVSAGCDGFLGCWNIGKFIFIGLISPFDGGFSVNPFLFVAAFVILFGDIILVYFIISLIYYFIKK